MIMVDVESCGSCRNLNTPLGIQDVLVRHVLLSLCHRVEQIDAQLHGL